jgi:hypothetical protein
MAQSNMNFLPNEVSVYTEEDSVLFENSFGRQDSVSESLCSNSVKFDFSLVQLEQEERRGYF